MNATRDWYVYAGKNATKKQVYYGASSNPEARINGSHCLGGTRALKNWDCDNDKITWSLVSKHRTKEKASEVAQNLETKQPPQGYTIIQTGGT